MVHPGRIKRGITYATEEGALFEAGEQYTLQISNQIVSQQNQALEQFYTKSLFIKAPDRRSPLHAAYQKSWPHCNTTSPLMIAFSEPMDFGAAQIGIKVTDTTGQTVEGLLTAITDYQYKFLPSKPWQNQTYTVQYNEYLTDLASNHFNRIFEVKDVKTLMPVEGRIFDFVPLK